MEMTWEYRVLHRTYGPKDNEGDSYTIIEVYYDDNDEIVSWSDKMYPYGDTVQELIADLDLMQKAARKGHINEEDLRVTLL